MTADNNRHMVIFSIQNPSSDLVEGVVCFGEDYISDFESFDYMVKGLIFNKWQVMTIAIGKRGRCNNLN